MPITFAMCTKFICLRVKITFTLQGAVSVTSTDVDKVAESQKKRGKAINARGTIWKEQSFLVKRPLA